MNPRDIKRRANTIRKAMTSEAYYDRKYKDLRVADLLIVLEDDNYHSEETVLEAIATLDYYKIMSACELVVELDEARNMSYDNPDRADRLETLYELQKQLNERLTKGD